MQLSLRNQTPPIDGRGLNQGMQILSVRYWQVNPKPKPSALPLCAVDTDMAVHQGSQALDNRQAQPSAAIWPCAAVVDLAKRLEKLALLARCNPNTRVTD